MGTQAGVAKKSMVHPVRVFGCQGSTSWATIIKAIDWVAANHEKPAIINMSLGGGKNSAINTAVKNATNAGVHVVVSAGNSNASACNYSPASAPSAITIASSTSSDARSSFSNKGSCVDLIAPGSSIVSASHQSDTGFRTLSGTSMSSPHVAGAAALALESNPALSAADLETLLKAKALKGKISNVGTGTPNLLLYVKGFNNAPIVTAGPDQYIRLPINKATLTGIAKDSDGFITEATWAQVSGAPVKIKQVRNFEWKQMLMVEGFVEGAYKFRFYATDDKGTTSSDEVMIFVNSKNLAPVAKAGPDQYIKSTATAQVGGSDSFDNDGTIASYNWSQKSGPNTATIMNPTKAQTDIKDFVPGVYEFVLTVKDNEGASGTDLIKIKVNAKPVVDAGANQKIEWPKNSAALLATASDALSQGIKGIKWYQVSGPNAATFSSKNTLATTVNGLVVGTYVFQIQVTDDMGEKASDTVSVEVFSINKPPVVSAGADITITLPNDEATLLGSCNDADGFCVKTSWKLVSKNFKSIIPISNKVDSNLMLSGLTEGVYVFRLTGEDNSMLTASDEMTLTVKPAAPAK